MLIMLIHTHTHTHSNRLGHLELYWPWFHTIRPNGDILLEERGRQTDRHIPIDGASVKLDVTHAAANRAIVDMTT